MESTYIIVKTTPFPPITGFEGQERAYFKLRSMWRRFRGEVRDLKHFMLMHTVRQFDNNKTWAFCAEYNAGKIILSWKDPKDVNKDLLPTLNGKGRVWTEYDS